MAESHTIKLRDRREIAEGVLELRFSKPSDFHFRAGQSADWTLLSGERDEKGLSRTMTIVSAPHEDSVAFATRTGESAFKRAIAVLEPDSEIHFEGPFGTFFLQDDASDPVIFLAGGIGITPFRSMIVDAAHRVLRTPMTLLCADAAAHPPFTDELLEISRAHSFLSVFQTTEALSLERIEEHVPEYRDAIFYLAGPRAMVFELWRALSDAGIAPERIRFEEFAGYERTNLS